jgi:hypothetical protein
MSQGSAVGIMTRDDSGLLPVVRRLECDVHVALRLVRRAVLVCFHAVDRDNL